MTKKEKLIENMDISLGSLLNEIHYMEVAIERMEKRFGGKDEHYISIIEYFKNMVKNYRLDFTRFTHLRNLAATGKPTLEALEIYDFMIEDARNHIFDTSEYVWSTLLDENIEDYVEDYDD